MSIRQGRPEDYSKGPYLIVLDVAPCPAFSAPPFRPPIPLEFCVEVKLDKWMLILNINHLLGLIINLTSDSKQTFHLCSFPVSRLHFTFSPPLSLSLRKLCNAFYLFTKANTHLPRRHGVRCISRPAKSPYTCSYFTLDRRERRRGRDRGEKREEGRPSC